MSIFSNKPDIAKQSRISMIDGWPGKSYYTLSTGMMNYNWMPKEPINIVYGGKKCKLIETSFYIVRLEHPKRYMFKIRFALSLEEFPMNVTYRPIKIGAAFERTFKTFKKGEVLNNQYQDYIKTHFFAIINDIESSGKNWIKIKL